MTQLTDVGLTTTSIAYVEEFDSGAMVYRTNVMNPAAAEFYAISINNGPDPVYAVVRYLTV